MSPMLYVLIPRLFLSSRMPEAVEPISSHLATAFSLRLTSLLPPSLPVSSQIQTLSILPPP